MNLKKLNNNHVTQINQKFIILVSIPIAFLSLVKVFCVFVMMIKHLDGLPVKLCAIHGKISMQQFDVLVMVTW